MAKITPGRFTAKMDEPFVVFIVGMCLPLHKDPAAVDRGVIPARPTKIHHNVTAV